MHRSTLFTPAPGAATAVALSLLPFFATPARAQDAPALSVGELAGALKSGKTDEALAERLRRWIGPERIKQFPGPRTADLTAAWAVEVPGANGASVAVVADKGPFRLPLTRVGATDVHAGVASLPEGAGLRWHYEVGGERKGDGGLVEVYTTPAEMKKQPGVPEGKLTQMPEWRSQAFPDTVRDWWVYVPAQYDGKTPACVMVFQDGGGAKSWAPTAFDNLIAKGDMPVTVGIFLNPGRRTDQQPGDRPRNRSVEYDTLSDRYARFLLDEILPEVEKTVKLRRDPAGRAICGESSGGICAFTVAWERPDQFGKVVSHIGSFVNLAPGESGIAGGHNYPPLIRKSKANPKQIRVFLQDGANDLDNPFGNWPLANQEMAAALKWAGYDHKFVFGQGAHNGSHGRAIFPDTMRWLWRDWKQTPAPAAAR